MKYINRKKQTALIIVLFSVLVAQSAAADGDIRWPLMQKDDITEPRRAIWNSFGEFQGSYIHPGIDIMGNIGDRAMVVKSGQLLYAANLNACVAGGDYDCRVYILGNDNYIYYYSHLRQDASSVMTSSMRATLAGASGVLDLENTDFAVTENDILANITDYAATDGVPWYHLHFGIFADAWGNFDSFNPLDLLKRLDQDPPIQDDEPPIIADVEFYEAGSAQGFSPDQVVPNPDECNRVSGVLDIVAFAKDTFYTENPAPADFTADDANTIGIYRAEYRIRNQRTGLQEASGEWYNLSRAPHNCPGQPTGSCPANTNFQYADHAEFFGELGSGAAPYWGVEYVDEMYSDALSSHSYYSSETFAHIMTSSWGEWDMSKAWDTTALDSGEYQVSVDVWDADNKGDTFNLFVFVQNEPGAINYAYATPDAYMADHDDDDGAIPSNSADQAYWRSPDIWIVGEGEDPAQGTARVYAGETYHLYLQIHNDRCVDVNNIKAKIYSARPQMIQDESFWIPITDGDEFVGTVDDPEGISLIPGHTALLGPFEWTPTPEEASENDGHRCLMAKIDSPDDGIGNELQATPDNNNIAQRNVQVDPLTQSFVIINTNTMSSEAIIKYRCNGFPFYRAADGAVAEIEVDVTEYPTIASDWAGAEGATVTYNPSTQLMTVRFDWCDVDMPPTILPAHVELPTNVHLALPGDDNGEYTIDMEELLNGVTRGGMAFYIAGGGPVF
ncbi:MAG: M23 family metallopeptidase [Deltaproteobacteria bacterium]|nr:M23 family metallopeptidase [Deltaproteobacteria bacterium]